ncbi:MAG: hypothetical protein WCW68_08925 [Methanothrix sp.]
MRWIFLFMTIYGSSAAWYFRTKPATDTIESGLNLISMMIFMAFAAYGFTRWQEMKP